jgi:hypothetical protein
MNNTIFQYSSAIIGALAVLAVAYVFVRKYTFQMPGFGLLIAGTVLIGLPVWQSAKLSWNKEHGFDFEFVTKQLQALNAKLNDVQTASAQATTELKGIASNIDKVRTTTTFDFASRVAANSPEHKNAVTDKLKPLSSSAAFDPAAAETLAKDPQLQGWIKNAELLSKKVEESLAVTKVPPPEG